MPSRREFIGTSVAGALATGFVPLLERMGSAAAPLDILILGGTGFIGPHLVRHAVSRGHRITIFTRGRHDADLPTQVTRLTGDRTGDMESLKGKRWDAVVDDSANTPDWVVRSTELLKDSVGTYLFTSSTGVFYPYLGRGLTESTPIHYDVKDPKDGSETFAVAKAQCEKQLFDVFGKRGIVVRATYIVGPGDTSDRFPYWPVRLAKGGDVLAPGHADDPVQFIDVRDLAEFMVHLLETNGSGVYDVAGPKAAMTARQFYHEAVADLKSNATLTYVDDYDFLAAHKIDEAIPWAMLKGNDFGMMSVKNDRAVGAGLKFRPLATTLRDTLAWWPSVPEARRTKPRFTITPAIETAALADWRAQQTLAGTIVSANMTANTASVVDIATGAVRATYPTGEGPHEVAISNDGKWAVVSVYGARGSVGHSLLVLDLAGSAAPRAIEMGDFRRPHGMRFLPGDKQLIVTSEVAQKLALVDFAAGSVASSIAIDQGLTHMVVIDQSGKRAFTTNIDHKTVSVIDIERATVLRTIDAGVRIEGIAINPDATEVWVGANDAKVVLVFNTSTGEKIAELGGFGIPYRMAITSDGATAVVSDPGSERVVLVDAKTHAVRTAIDMTKAPGLPGDVGEHPSPQGVTLSRDGLTAFITLKALGKVAVINIATASVLKTLSVGGGSDGIGYSPEHR